MRIIVLLLTGVLMISGCKKKAEDVQLDALMSLITNGQWKVTRYMNGSTDVTSQFTPYAFQFKTNETVDALKNGVVDKTGTWVGNATARTIQSSFGNVEMPLHLLNGTWYITKTSTTYVEASQKVNSEEKMLRLDKL